MTLMTYRQALEKRAADEHGKGSLLRNIGVATGVALGGGAHLAMKRTLDDALSMYRQARGGIQYTGDIIEKMDPDGTGRALMPLYKWRKADGLPGTSHLDELEAMLELSRQQRADAFGKLRNVAGHPYMRVRRVVYSKLGDLARLIRKFK